MSRSAIVMLVAGAILFAVAGYVFLHFWPVLALKSTGMKALLIGLAVYGAALSAVMIRRIGDPGLPMPILAWLVAIVYYIWGTFNKSDYEKQHEHMHAADPEKSSDFGKQGTGMGWAIFLTLVGLGMYGTGLGWTYAMGKHTLEAGAPVATDKPKTPDKPVEKAAAPDKQPVAKPVPSDVTDMSDLKSAIAYAGKSMTNDSEPSEGSKQLAKWLAKRGKWADVSVAKNETSLDLVEKDAAAQRGKKLCVAGTLERIEKTDFESMEFWSARLVTAQKDALELYAVGKTGDLVKRKPAKFCGVITGAERDGRGTVAFAAGMFDTNK